LPLALDLVAVEQRDAHEVVPVGERVGLYDDLLAARALDREAAAVDVGPHALDRHAPAPVDGRRAVTRDGADAGGPHVGRWLAHRHLRGPDRRAALDRPGT